MRMRTRYVGVARSLSSKDKVSVCLWSSIASNNWCIKLEPGGRRVSLTLPALSGAGAKGRRGGGGGAQQQALLLQPAATPQQMTYILQPAPYPVYQPLVPQFPGAQYPVSWSLPPPPYIAPPQPFSLQLPTQHLQEEEEEEGERCFQGERQSYVRREEVEGVEKEVGEGITISVLPDLVREVVNETISDIVFSYIGHKWESHAIPKPNPPPVTSLLSPLPRQQYLYHHGNEDLIGRHRQPSPHLLLHLITHYNTETELCKAVTDHLLEQMMFQSLLTSDLDSGVSMATRTQSKHILTEMIFNELLVKLITRDSAHSN